MWNIEKIIRKGKLPLIAFSVQAYVMQRITHTVEIAISENILAVYRKYAVDNPEETLIMGFRRDYTQST